MLKILFGVVLIALQTVAVSTFAPCRDLEFYGGFGDNVFDNTPALNAALAAGDRSMCLRAGYYRFNTKPMAISISMRLEGAGVSETALVKAWSSVSQNDALIDFVGSGANGATLAHMSVVANDSSGGSLVRIKSLYQSPASYITLDDLNFTYGPNANYDLAIFIDGLEANGGAQGVRTPKLSKITAFQAPNEWWAVDFENVVNLMISDFWTNGSIKLSGLYTPSTTNISTTFSNVIVGDAIYMESSTGISIHGQCYRLYAQATALNGSFHGFAFAVYNSSPTFKVY